MFDDMFERLKSKISEYNSDADFTMLEKAYKIAGEAHRNQTRKSGEPYILHPLETAFIIAELELDMESLVASILHDVVEDTEATYDSVKSEFGEEVANLVEGVTKLTAITYKEATNVDKQEIQAENYRKMFLAMSSDIRVILIKLADRLHNMRTLKYLSEEKQQEIAKETLNIYAPLANRLGISKIKIELEDLSLRYLQPEIYYDLVNKINIRKSEREEIVNQVIHQLETELAKSNIKGEVQGRAKHFFSIYKKMHSKNKTLDEIYDLFAVRVIVTTIRDCYEVLGIMHEFYKPLPGRFKDYIAMPKANMYQSLHSTLLDKKGNPFEVQIRTYDMHRIAENGIAAHWMYKEGIKNTNDRLAEKLTWLKEVLEWKKTASTNSNEFVNNIKLELDVFNDEVYVFSPRGDVVALPQGSTPIDFAYYIHSAVGNKMVGAKVNDKIVTFDYTLKTGDRIEIITSQNSKGPNRDWLSMVKTQQARSKISMWFKQLSKDESIVKGKELLEEAAKKKGIRLEELLRPKWKEQVLQKYGVKDFDAIYTLIGHGDLKESQIVNKLYSYYEKENQKEITVDEVLEKSIKERQGGDKAKSGVLISEIGDVAINHAKCCNPIPGDEIVGYITKGRGVSVHRTDCRNIILLSGDEKRKLLPAEWKKGQTNVYYRSDIRIIATDRKGLLVDVTKAISDAKIPIKLFDAKTIEKQAIFTVAVELLNREQLEKLINSIKRIKNVMDVVRISG